MHLYFAYGSNMLPRQMAERCPGARPLGAATLRDWRFIITTRGTANIERERGASVHGVLWSCHQAHLRRLDLFEGVHWNNYIRRMELVDFGGERHWTAAFTYVSARRYRARARPNYMLTAVMPGARAFGLPAHYMAELESWMPDYAGGAANNRYRGRRRLRPGKR